MNKKTVLIVSAGLFALGFPSYLVLYKHSEPMHISSTMMAKHNSIYDIPKERHLPREVQRKRTELLDILDETEQLLD